MQVLAAVKTFISFVGAKVAVGLNIAAGVKATMAIGGAVIAGTALAAKKVMGMLEVSMPKVDTDASRQSTVKSTTEPYKIIYGETLVSGPIFFVGAAGTDNQDLYYAIALAGHEVESITDIHFDNIVIPNADINSGNAAGGSVGGTGTFSPKQGGTIVRINKHKGESTQTADSMLTGAFSGRWTTAHKARGIAYIVTKWTLNEDSAETWDKFTPRNIMAKVKGRKIYDPRKDSTSSAYDSSLGVSDHRFTDPSTWDWSDNPALCLADYLTAVDFTDAGSFIVGKDYRIESVGTTDFTAIGAASNTVGVRFTATGVGSGTGKASRPSFGMGIVESKIDWDAVATAADGCDVSVDIPDSATEKRFTANGVVFGTDSHRTNIDKILSAMNGNLTYVNGKYVVRAGIYEAHTVDLDEDDLIDGVSVKTSLERGDRFNTVKGLFLDPDSNNKTVEFPKVQLADALSRDNNEELHKEIALNMTNSSYMAQRIANKLIQLSDQQKVIVFPANMSAVRVSVGDRVRVTIGDLSFSNKVFQCIGWTFNEEGGVNLTLREDDSNAYADPLPGAYSTVASTGLVTDGFRGVPGPSGLRGVSGEDKVFLDWVNPGNPQDFETIHVFAGTNNDFDHADTVKVGETDGSQFTVESKTGAGDGSEFSAGNTRYFWVRAIKFKGTSSEAQSGTHPGTTQGVSVTIAATSVDWGNVADPTIGLDLTSDTISIVYDSETTQTGQGISQSGIGQGVSVASGGITMTTGGAIKGGQTAYDTGTGFFLGYDSTAHKFSIGNSNSEKLTFDGTNLTVSGSITATSLDVSSATVTGTISADNIAIDDVTLDTDGSGNLIIASGGVDTTQLADNSVNIDKIADSIQSTDYVANTSGWKLTTDGTFEAGDGTFRGALTATSGTFAGSVSVNTAGKMYGGTMSSFNTGAGFFLGYDTDAYKFSVGNASGKVLTWDGEDLNVQANAVSFTTGGAPDYDSNSRFPTSMRSSVLDLSSNTDYVFFDNKFDQNLTLFAGFYAGPLTSGSISGETNAQNAIMAQLSLQIQYAPNNSGTPGTWTNFGSAALSQKKFTATQLNSNYYVKTTNLGGGNYRADLATASQAAADFTGLGYSEFAYGITDEDYYLTERVTEYGFPKGEYFFRVVVTVTDGTYSPYPATGSPSLTNNRRLSIPNALTYTDSDHGTSAVSVGNDLTYFTSPSDNQTLVDGGSISLMPPEENPTGNKYAGIFIGGRGETSDASSIQPLGGIWFYEGMDDMGTGAGSLGSPDFAIYMPPEGGNLLIGGNVNFNNNVDVDGTLSINGVTVNAGAVTGPAGSDGQIQYNNGGALGGSSNLTFDDSTNTLSVTNLTVSGTTTTIDTTNLNVSDKNITLNYGTGDTSANADGAGITIQDAVDSSSDASITWNAANDLFTFSHGATFGYNTIDPDSFANTSGGFGNISDGSGWGARGVYVHGGGTGDAAAMAHNGSRLYFGIQDGSTANSMATWLDVQPNKQTTFAAAATFAGAITSSGLVTGTGGVLGDPYLQTKGADGAIAVYIDSKSSFDGSNVLNAPMIEWRESDSTNIAGIRGYVDASGNNKLALGTGFFDEELTITSSGIVVAGTVTWSGGGSANANTAYTYSQVGHVPLAGGTMTGALTIGGSNTNGISLKLRSGDVGNGTDSTQIRLGYNNTDDYSHRIVTRHQSGGAANNAIDFYVWNYGTDANAALPTKRVLIVDGYDEGVIYAPNLGINTTDNTVLGGTQVYIKKRDGNHNLMRWGEGDVNNRDSYRFRIDQSFKFIADGGDGGTTDTFILSSETGAITGKGNWSTTGTLASGAQTITHANGTIGLANAALKITNTGSQSMIYFTDGTNADGSIRVDDAGNMVFNSRSANYYFGYDFGTDPQFYNYQTKFLSVSSGEATFPETLTVQNSVASGSYLSDANVYALKVQNPNTTAGNATAIAFGHGGYSFTSYIASIRKGTGADPWGDISIGTRPADDTTFTDQLYIVGNTGNVSLGRTYADGKLHVYSTGASTDVYIDNRKTYGSGNANDSVSRLFLSISENDTNLSADQRQFAMFKAGTLSDSTSANGYAQIGVRSSGSIENVMIGAGNAGTSFHRDGNSYYGVMQRGAIEIGSTSRSFKYTSGWASSMQGGILANTYDDWEFVIHDSNDALASAFVYDNAGANIAGDFTLGRDLGWGGSRIFIADQLIANRGGTLYNSASTSAIFGKLNASSSAVVITNETGNAHTWLGYNDGSNYITADGTDSNPYTHFRTYSEPGGSATYVEYMRVGASMVDVYNGSKLIIRDATAHSTNGAAFNISAGANDQVNINSSGDTNWGLLIGYGDGTLTTGYHGNNHAAIINVQNAPLHLGTNNTSQMRIRADGGVEIDNRLYAEGGAYFNHVANSVTSISNADAGATNFSNRGNRLLTSNGTNWAADGRDPMFAFTTSGNSNATTIGHSIGITMHNESPNDNTFSPMIAFSNKSNSGSYNTTYAAIMGKKTGQGVDSNWSAGELWFYAMPGSAYAQNLPNMRIMGNEVEINGSTASAGDTALTIRGYTTSSVQYDPIIRLVNDAATPSEGLEIWYDNSVGTSYITNKFSTGSLKFGTATGSAVKSQSNTRFEITGGGSLIFGGQDYSPYISETNENTLNGGWNQNVDTADLWINYRGYQDGVTRFRDFRIGNGKNSALVHLDGSANRWNWENGTEQFNWKIHADSDSADAGWDTLTFQSTTEWGDSSQYGVLGGDGTYGVMLRRPHVVWNSSHGSADIRFGRSGGVSSGDWYNVGVKTSNQFFIAQNDSNILQFNGVSSWDFLANTIMFNSSTSRQITGSSTNGYNTVDIYGNWDRFQIMGRVIDWSASNLHFGDGYNGQTHSGNYAAMGYNNTNLEWRFGGNIVCRGNITAYYSDARLKENVTPIANAICIVKAIRGVEFDWNEKAPENFDCEAGEHDFGFIAQEVEAVFPMGVVHQGDVDRAEKYRYGDPDSEWYDPLWKDTNPERYKTVKYDKMVAVAVQAIKEQQDIIESQQAQIDELRTLINKLMEK